MARPRGPEPVTRRARRVAGQRRAVPQNSAAYAPPAAPSKFASSGPETLSAPVTAPPGTVTAPPSKPEAPKPPRRSLRDRLGALRVGTAGRSGRGPGERGRWHSIIAIVLIGLIVVFGTLAGLYLQGYLHARPVAGARDDALAAAKVGVPKFASYSYKSFDSDVSTADHYLTPKFRAVYDNFQQKSVRATALKYQATVNGQVAVAPDGSLEAGVISASHDKVRVLVFLNQTTTNTKLAAPKVSQSRLRVDMRKVAGRWLIDQVTAF